MATSYWKIVEKRRSELKKDLSDLKHEVAKLVMDERGDERELTYEEEQELRFLGRSIAGVEDSIDQIEAKIASVANPAHFPAIAPGHGSINRKRSCSAPGSCEQDRFTAALKWLIESRVPAPAGAY